MRPSPTTTTGCSTTTCLLTEARSTSPRRHACCSGSAAPARCWTRPAARASMRRCSRAGVSPCGRPTQATRWPRVRLPGSGERFDVVLCTGNALVHAAGRDAMVQALAGLRRMARPGGHVVVDSRNWEKLHAERRIVQVADRVVTRGERRCLALYAWEVPDRHGDQHI